MLEVAEFGHAPHPVGECLKDVLLGIHILPNAVAVLHVPILVQTEPEATPLKSIRHVLEPEA